MRFAPLDVDELANDVAADLRDAEDFAGELTTALAMTCLDQAGATATIFSRGEARDVRPEAAVGAAAGAVGAGRGLASWGPTRGTLRAPI